MTAVVAVMDEVGRAAGLEPLTWRCGVLDGRPWLVGWPAPGEVDAEQRARVVEVWASALGLPRRDNDYGALEYEGPFKGCWLTVWTVVDRRAWRDCGAATPE